MDFCPAAGIPCRSAVAVQNVNHLFCHVYPPEKKLVAV
jgi:hypothetical protein